MRKFLSVLLAMAMVLSLSVTSFAADTDSEAKAEMAGKTVILHTNDVHGAIEGYAYITALTAAYAAKGAEVILVDAGDYSQGEGYVSDTKGLDAVEMMNVTGYDVVTLGNHEFDYGYAQLKENMTKADFKILCANVYGEDGIPIFDANYTYTTKSGVKIGFFGMETPEAQTKANPALIKGLKFDTDLTAVAEKQLEALKDAFLEAGIKGMTISQVQGCGNQHGWKEYYRGSEVIVNMLPKIMLTVVVEDDKVNSTVELICNTARTGEVGDGKIFVSPVEQVVRIRTGESGEGAV